MILRPTNDMDLVLRFMTLDEVWSLCADDFASKDVYYPPTGNDKAWLVAWEGFEVIGMIYVHQQTSSTIQMHPYLLSGHKHKVRELGRLFFEWAWSIPQFMKVNVTVPFIYHKLRNCCLKCGFKDEGINRLSYLKNGQLVDQWYMGSCRGES